MDASSLFISSNGCGKWRHSVSDGSSDRDAEGWLAVAFFKIHGIMYLKNLKLKIFRWNFSVA
jgi:hypothetical protein